MLWSNNNLFFETNPCVLWVISALSSGVFPARNRILCQITNSRKIPPPARFILPDAAGARAMSLFKPSRFLFGTVLPICPVEATFHNSLADPEGGRMFIERPYKPFTDPEGGRMSIITTYDHLRGRDFFIENCSINM